MKPVNYFFQKMLRLPKKTRFIVHNVYITNPNGMNQSFTYKQKYNLEGKKISSSSLSFWGFIFLLAELKFGLIVVVLLLLITN